MTQVLNLVPKWSLLGALLGQCEMVITNLSNDPLSAKSPLQFKLGDWQQVPKNTLPNGFDNFSQTGNIAQGTLTNGLQPGQSLKFLIPVKFGMVTLNPVLPSNFLINNLPVNPINDVTAPSAPQNLTVVNQTVKSLTLQWDPSTDNLGSVVYNVVYQQGNNPEKAVQTKGNQVTLDNLLPGAEYRLKVAAADLSHNESLPSPLLITNTLPALPFIPSDLKTLPTVNALDPNTPDLGKFLDVGGVKNFLLSSVSGVSVPSTKDDGALPEIIPAFGGLNSLTDSNLGLNYPGDARNTNYMKETIHDLVAKGGKVAMTFGGNNLPMEHDLTDVTQITQNYEDIIKNYNLTHLNFDFVEGFLNNPDGLSRFITAILPVMKNHPDLQTSYTLPLNNTADLTGLSSNAVNLLQLLSNEGIKPSLINLVPVGAANNFSGIKSALEGSGLQDINSQTDANKLGALQQLMNVYPDLTKADAFKMLSVSPSLGQLPGGGLFSITDQASLVTYALLHGLSLGAIDANTDVLGVPNLLPPALPGAFLGLLSGLTGGIPILPPIGGDDQNETVAAGLTSEEPQ